MTQSPEWKEEINAIEHAVRERRTLIVRRAIPRLLRLFPAHYEESLLQACDWYRRLGLHTEGLRLVGLNAALIRSPKSEFDRQRMLWSARSLNLLGATEFAQVILSHFEPVSAEEFRVLGAIHLAHFDYKKAAAHLKRFNQLDSDPSRYISRLSQINLADALFGLGQADRAFTLAQETEARSTEPLLQAIALQAQGEYRARAGRFREAVPLLTQGQANLPADDQSPDMGILLKWKGYALLRLGKRELGLRDIKASLAILRSSSLRPEAWLDVYRLLAVADELKPSLIQRLNDYPGLAPGFKKSLPVSTHPARIQNATWKIDLERDEYLIEGKPHLGVPLELRAAAFISIAGDWGLPVVKLKSLLWPDQAHAFLQLGSRVDQLLHRLRTAYPFDILVEQGTAILRSPAVQVIAAGPPLPPGFLRKRAQFTRADVETYYSLASAQASRRVKEWEERKWITRSGSGPGISYKSFC